MWFVFCDTYPELGTLTQVWDGFLTSTVEYFWLQTEGFACFCISESVALGSWISCLSFSFFFLLCLFGFFFLVWTPSLYRAEVRSIAFSICQISCTMCRQRKSKTHSMFPFPGHIHVVLSPWSFKHSGFVYALRWLEERSGCLLITPHWKQST